jgi:hypothetical protein
VVNCLLCFELACRLSISKIKRRNESRYCILIHI